MSKPVVFVGIPCKEKPSALAEASARSCTRELKGRVCIEAEASPVGCWNFNKLFCRAWNLQRQFGVTHFLLHHDDVSAEAGSLDVMLREMEASGADVLAGNVAMKDGSGYVSTGWQDPKTLMPVQKFTLEELEAFPATFDAAGCRHAGHWLMVNDAFLLIKLSPAWESFEGFDAPNRIIKHSTDGLLHAHCLSEDYNFSNWVQAVAKLRLFATSAVQIAHVDSSGKHFLNRKAA